MGIFEKINICSVIKGHFRTLYNLETNKPSWSEIVIFYILPIVLITLPVFHLNCTITETFGNLLFQAFAIMGGFLINALVMLMDRRQKYNDSKQHSNRVTLIEETYANTAFGVLICFSIVILTGIAASTSHSNKLWNTIITSITYYLAVIFVHTLLMVIKRLEKIFRH